MYLTVDQTQHKTESVNLKTINENYPHLTTEGKKEWGKNRKEQRGIGPSLKKEKANIFMTGVPEGEERNQVEAKFENNQEFSKTDEKYESTDQQPSESSRIKRKKISLYSKVGRK